MPKRILEGVVVSDKGDKTVVVKVERFAVVGGTELDVRLARVRSIAATPADLAEKLQPLAALRSIVRVRMGFGEPEDIVRTM